MTGRDMENPLVVALTALLAVAGVGALRVGMGLDYHHWGLVYLAMGLTASIRRTSAGIGCSTLSAFRGMSCLVAGLYACQFLGYPVGSLQPRAWVPEEVAMVVARFQ